MSNGIESRRHSLPVIRSAVCLKASAMVRSSPDAADGSLQAQFAVTGAPGQTGQASRAALSQTAMTMSIGIAPGCTNSSHDLLRNAAT